MEYLPFLIAFLIGTALHIWMKVYWRRLNCNFGKAESLFPVPNGVKQRFFSKRKVCAVEDQYGGTVQECYLRILNNGLLITEKGIILSSGFKLFTKNCGCKSIFVPRHALFEMKLEQKPWFIRWRKTERKDISVFQIQGTPMILFLQKDDINSKCQHELMEV